MKIKLLAWDTDFFKMKIGAAVMEKKEYGDIDTLYRSAKRNNYILLYIACDSRLPETQLPQGATLVDIKTTLRVSCAETRVDDPGRNIVEYQGGRVSGELEQLALESGTYSRFHLDSRFPDSLFRKLYKQWIKNSVRKKLADAVFVYLGDAQKPIGFITIKKKNKSASVGLIAVDKRHRKKHIGSNLLQKAVLWSNANGCNYLTVTTQYDNDAAMHVYRKFGFGVIQKKYFYHYWIN